MPEQSAYAPTDRTVPTRHRERATYDRTLVHAILDEAYVCHLGFVRDETPVVLPTLFGRVGERLYLHGSTGSRPARLAGAKDRGQDASGDAASGQDDAGQDEGGQQGAGDGGAGLAVCVTVTHVDALVLARAAFNHSVNYRSVMIHGIAHQVTDPKEKQAALDALVNHVLAGRAADSRPANPKELAATAVLRLDLDEVAAKVRTGGPSDEPEDMSLPHWAGIVPVHSGYGPPVPSDDLADTIAVPDYLTAL